VVLGVLPSVEQLVVDVPRLPLLKLTEASSPQDAHGTEEKMKSRLDFEKSLQAAAYLLHLEEGRMPYLRLMKLMYIAERELLAQTATPLTGDICVAIEHGPVLSHVLDLIKGKGSGRAEWEGFIQRNGYAVKLVAEPGRGRLSGHVIDKLAEVSERYREKGHWELRDLTHDFPEWQKNFPGEGSALIPLKDILEAQGESQETLTLIRERETVRQHMAKIFGIRKPKKPPEPVEWDILDRQGLV
jgi:uncharacterized phage-associated protein